MNRLARESSIYLKQHASNPVDWYPWGEEAKERARAEDRPIFLSIGYSSCHWCHVMAQESFEDGEVAGLLNGRFVPVKVDREERPDLDAIYMRAAMLMGSSGGWPLSVFLTPDLEPFFAGTYFPPERRWGAPSFKEVLQRVSEAYASHRGEVRSSAAKVFESVRGSFSPPSADRGEIRPGLADAARRAITRMYDRHDGGFGRGPKFPQPPLLEFLVSEHCRHPEEGLGEAVLFTMRKMADGGIRDQIGGGFHRYSVDGAWMVPHFEKMLYDNAQLASLYFDIGARFDNQELTGVGCEILDDMKCSFAAPRGGFISAIDADSGGREGAYYLWSERELSEVLGGRADLFSRFFALAHFEGSEGAGVIHCREGYRGTGANTTYTSNIEH